MKRLICIFFFLNQVCAYAQTWYPVGAGVYNSSGGGYVQCFGLYNNELYLSGNFTNSDTMSTYGIARWNGTVFNKVDSGVYLGIPYAFAVHQSFLYAGGDFTS